MHLIFISAFLGALVLAYSQSCTIIRGCPFSEIGETICQPPKSSTSRLLHPFWGGISSWFDGHIGDAEGWNLSWYDDPWLVNNMPAYANWTSDSGVGFWTAHLHASLYKRVTRNKKEINDTTNRFMVKSAVRKYPWWSPRSRWEVVTPDEAAHARLIVNDIAHRTIKNAVMAVDFPECADEIKPFGMLTNAAGAVDQWIRFPDSCNKALGGFPNETGSKSSIGVRTSNSSIQPYFIGGERHKTSRDTRPVFLVPPRGLSIVSDIDDVLKVAEIWNLKQLVLNGIARPFRP